MLTEQHLAKIKALQDFCEREGYLLKLNWDMLRHRRADEQPDDYSVADTAISPR